MSEATTTLVVIVVWLCLGVTLALVMGRRGHAPYGWLVLGALTGPFAVLLALDAARHEKTAAQQVAAGVPSSGPVDVLVGIDGSDSSIAAAREVVTLLGDRLGRLVLARVADFDVAGGPVRSLRDDAQADLRRAAASLEPLDPELLLLTGKPSTALAEAAAAFDLLVIGTRGRGLSRAFVGSVATSLAAASEVPVMLVGAERHASAAGRHDASALVTGS